MPTIFVLDPDGITQTVPIEATTTVKEVKVILATHYNVNPSHFALVFNGMRLEDSDVIQENGVVDNDVLRIMPLRRITQSQPIQLPHTATTGREQTSPASSGGLDFSSLLHQTQSSSATHPTHQSFGTSTHSGVQSALIPDITTLARTQSAAIEWEGMTMNDIFDNNTNPLHIVQIFRRHENALKELNFHNPKVAKIIREKSEEEAVAEVRKRILQTNQQSFMMRVDVQQREREMENRLHQNPYDKEANEYFAEKIAQENIEEQRIQMMQQYPEAMGRVLMLYINAEVNGKPVTAFVDSGAETSIMSSACAERLDILRLVDKRFGGVAKGVGTGKILGKVHLVNLSIRGYFFPCSITVMDSKQGLGDENMDFLFGLDMLKRHRCSINLAKGCLTLAVDGKEVSTPFLHEFELDVSKGGTQGFRPQAEHDELDEQEAEDVARATKNSQGDLKPSTSSEPQAEPAQSSGMTSQSSATPSTTRSSPTTGLFDFNLDLGAIQAEQTTSQSPPSTVQSTAHTGVGRNLNREMQEMYDQFFEIYKAQGHDASTAAAMALRTVRSLQDAPGGV